jgi:hypothetical protein
MIEDEKRKQLSLIVTRVNFSYVHYTAEDGARFDEIVALLDPSLTKHAEFSQRSTDDAVVTEMIAKYGIDARQPFLIAETTTTITSRDDEQQQQSTTAMAFPGPFEDSALAQLLEHFLKWQVLDHILLGDFDTLPCLSTGSRAGQREYCVLALADTMSRSSFDLGSRILKYLALTQFTAQGPADTHFTFRLVDTARKQALYDHMARDLELVNNAHTQLHHQLLVVSLKTGQFWQYDRPLTFQRATDYPALSAWLSKIMHGLDRAHGPQSANENESRDQRPITAEPVPDRALIEYNKRRQSTVATVVSYGITLGLAVNFLLRMTHRALQFLA